MQVFWSIPGNSHCGRRAWSTCFRTPRTSKASRCSNDRIRAGGTVNRLFALIAALLFAGLAGAQPYPSKPIRLIVPFVPGGNVDITARTVAPALGEALGQPIVVEKRNGAAGMVGAQALLAAPADGYTLMMGSNSSLAVAPNLYANWPYDPVKGIAPITNLQVTPFVLVVRLGLPAANLTELLKIAKDKPGQLSMA